MREPGTHFSLTNLGPMGGAVPLGIGAKLVRPERPLMVATGDGCMLMHGMEVHTAAREKVPLVIALMNNRSYGNIYFRASKMGPGPARLTDIPRFPSVAMGRLGRHGCAELVGHCRQHFLYFFPLPQGQGSLRPIFFFLTVLGVAVCRYSFVGVSVLSWKHAHEAISATVSSIRSARNCRDLCKIFSSPSARAIRTWSMRM